LQNAGFFFKTFSEYLTENKFSNNLNTPLTSDLRSLPSDLRPPTSDLSPLIILRHDVDLLPQNSLRFARIQAEMGIKGSYYFRAVPESWDEKIIKEIASLGHEVGYHYENMDEASSKLKVESSKLVPGNREYDQLLDLAYKDFCENLEKLRQLVPVSTICMHGSPKSKFDNKAIWDKYDYKALGLIGEPYYDMDFDKVFYLTDTGRRWDGWKVSVRDKVPQQELWNKQGLTFHSTNDIIRFINQQGILSPKHLPSVASAKEGQTPNNKPQTTNPKQQTTNNKQQTINKIMFTMHPQRWHDSHIPWIKELVMQNTKNLVKRWFFVR
jgi:hypothetical protein